MATPKVLARRRVMPRTGLRASVPILPVTLVLAMLALAGVGAQPVLTTRRGVPLPSAPGTPLGHGSYHVLTLELGSGDVTLASLDGSVQTSTHLAEALQALALREPQSQLRIQANATLPFTSVQEAVQLAQDKGLTRVALEIKHLGEPLHRHSGLSSSNRPVQDQSGQAPVAPGPAAPSAPEQGGPVEKSSTDLPPASSAGTPR